MSGSYYYHYRHLREEPKTFGEAVKDGLRKGIRHVSKDYFKNKIKNLKKELAASHNHRTNMHTRYTPSAAHAKKALLNIGKNYNHARRSTSTAHYIKTIKIQKHGNAYRCTKQI